MALKNFYPNHAVWQPPIVKHIDVRAYEMYLLLLSITGFKFEYSPPYVFVPKIEDYYEQYKPNGS